MHSREVSTQCVYLNTGLKNNYNRIDISNIQFIILDKSPYDIIIGVEARRNYNLTKYLNTYFSKLRKMYYGQ